MYFIYRENINFQSKNYLLSLGESYMNFNLYWYRSNSTTIKKGVCRFSIDFKIESNYYYYIRNNIVYSNMNNLKMRNHNLQI